MRAAVLLIALSLLGACGEAAPTDATPDGELIDTVGTSDPVIAAALEDPIMVDPSLAAQANSDAVRPPAEPYAAPVAPEWVAKRPDLKDEVLMSAPAPAPCPSCARIAASETLAMFAATLGGKTCGPIRYSASWAADLPPAMPLHPAAAVIEAAGANGPTCRLRAVSYSVPVAPEKLINWLYTRASKAGPPPAHQSDGTQHLLLGKTKDGTAYQLVVTAHGPNGSDVDLVVRN